MEKNPLMKCMMHIMEIPVLKFQHTKRKLPIEFFFIDVIGRWQKATKFDFQFLNHIIF